MKSIVLIQFFLVRSPLIFTVQRRKLLAGKVYPSTAVRNNPFSRVVSMQILAPCPPFLSSPIALPDDPLGGTVIRRNKPGAWRRYVYHGVAQCEAELFTAVNMGQNLARRRGIGTEQREHRYTISCLRYII